MTLVTGGTGFLGAHLVRLLAAGNRARLRVLVHSAPPAWLKATRWTSEIVSARSTSPDDIAKAVAGVEQIYHLAGMVSHKATDAHRMYAVHVDGTRLVCEAAARAGVSRIVMASTSGTVACPAARTTSPTRRRRRRSTSSGAGATTRASSIRKRRRARACGDKVELVTVNPSLLLGPGRRSPQLDAPRPAVPGPRDPADAGGRAERGRRARRRGAAAGGDGARDRRARATCWARSTGRSPSSSAGSSG